MHGVIIKIKNKIKIDLQKYDELDWIDPTQDKKKW